MSRNKNKYRDKANRDKANRLHQQQCPASQELQLNLPNAEYKALKELAQNLSLPVSAVAVLALKVWLDDYNHLTLEELYGTQQ